MAVGKWTVLRNSNLNRVRHSVHPCVVRALYP
jgi:hypothetical protein